MAIFVAWALLAFGTIFLLFAMAGAARPRIAGLRPYWDNVALFGNELAWPLAAIAVFALALALPFGAARSSIGLIGAAVTASAVALMAISFYRGWRDGPAMERALLDALGSNYLDRLLPERRRLIRDRFGFRAWARPLKMEATDLETLADIAYGPHNAFNTLDVLRSTTHAGGPRPVLLHIHGGGLVSGRKNLEALPLLHFMARRGWVVVTINYRLSPAARWPAHLVDVKGALSWVRQHIGEYGGDASFIAATGGSAGGTLSALLALTPEEPMFQPGFERLETSIQAAVPFYGSYEVAKGALRDHAAKLVMPHARAEDPALWDDLAPLNWVRADAPPFFVLHGSHDALAPVEEARVFVARLRAISRSPVAYAEQHGASHGFDAIHSPRTEFAVRAVQRFLECVYSDNLRLRSAPPTTVRVASVTA